MEPTTYDSDTFEYIQLFHVETSQIKLVHLTPSAQQSEIVPSLNMLRRFCQEIASFPLTLPSLSKARLWQGSQGCGKALLQRHHAFVLT